MLLSEYMSFNCVLDAFVSGLKRQHLLSCLEAWLYTKLDVGYCLTDKDFCFNIICILDDLHFWYYLIYAIEKSIWISNITQYKLIFEVMCIHVMMINNNN
jgi:hypothetical protein